MGFFVVPVALTLLRLSPFCRGPPAHPASSRVLRSRRLHPALLRASRSRFPAVRQFGTEPQPKTEPQPRPNAGLKPDLRCTQPLPVSTTRPPVLLPPPSSAKPAHSNHPPARNLQPDYRPESCRLARSHSPDPSRAVTRTGADLRCTQPLPVSTTRPPVLPPPPRSRTIL